MMRLAGISAFFILAAGCGVGDDGGTNPNPNPNGRVCGAVLATSGSFTPDAANPPPTDYEGCWPVGMWTFTVAVSMNDCSAAPTPLAQYQMKGIVMPDQNGDPLPEMTYVTAPGPRVIAKYSEGGSGLCEGELDLYLGEERYHLELGDSATFDSRTPHRWRNPSTQQSRVLWAFTPATY